MHQNMSDMNVKTTPISEADLAYGELYTRLRPEIFAASSPVVNALRDEAMAIFSRKGIPTHKVEEYKYTNLQPHFHPEWKLELKRPKTVVNPDELFQCDVPNLDSGVIYLVNGWFAGTVNLPSGVVVEGMMEAAQKYPGLFEQYYGKQAPLTRDAMVAMNTAFALDGIFLHIPRGVVVEKPIQVVHILSGSDDQMVFYRNLVVADAASQAKVLFCDHTLSAARFAVNGVTEVFAAEAVVFDWYHIQSQHNLTTQVNGLYVNQKKQSNVLTNLITLHCGVARNNIFVTLDDEHCESHLYGLYLADKNQHIDNYSFIDHAKPHCESNELFKGVLDDRASGSFTGSIMVRRDAQKTNAYQSNKNLLLTADAKFNTKPQLEIYADDVKCSHGATVGQLNDEAMFYLRARGISKEESRILLMYAFAYEVIEKIRVEPLKEQIKQLVEKRFRGELSKCESCVLCGQQPHLTQM